MARGVLIALQCTCMSLDDAILANALEGRLEGGFVRLAIRPPSDNANIKALEIRGQSVDSVHRHTESKRCLASGVHIAVRCVLQSIPSDNAHESRRRGKHVLFFILRRMGQTKA